MSIEVLALIALLPILVALVLMVGMRWPATKAMPLAWLTAAAGAILVWSLPVAYVAALTLQGFVTAIGILIIVFGAVLILTHPATVRRYGNHPVRNAEHHP